MPQLRLRHAKHLHTSDRGHIFLPPSEVQNSKDLEFEERKQKAGKDQKMKNKDYRRETETDRQRDRQGERDRQTDREAEREREIDRNK